MKAYNGDRLNNSGLMLQFNNLSHTVISFLSWCLAYYSNTIGLQHIHIHIVLYILNDGQTKQADASTVI